MCMLDLTTVEAQPIVQMLEGMGSALQFTLDHSLVHLPLLGQTTGTLCAVRMPRSCMHHCKKLRFFATRGYARKVYSLVCRVPT